MVHTRIIKTSDRREFLRRVRRPVTLILLSVSSRCRLLRDEIPSVLVNRNFNFKEGIKLHPSLRRGIEWYAYGELLWSELGRP